MLNRVIFASLFMFLIVLGAAISANPAGAQECSSVETRPCGSNIGACQSGERLCQDGEWSDCLGEIGPQPEICDNKIDDDCNGIADECIKTLGPIMILAGFIMLFIMGILIKLGF